MRVLITGIGGMLGNDLARVLKDSHQVIGIGRRKRKFEKKIQYFTCDLLKPARLEKYIRKIRPQVIIHSAAKTKVDDCELNPVEAYRENVLATQFLLRAVSPYKPLFVYISTDYVFDGSKNRPYVEQDVPAPLNVYGATKLLGEKLVQDSGLRWVIVRTSWLYGLKGSNFVATILKVSHGKKELKVVTDQTGSPTYTKDLAEALKNIMESRNIRGIFNVTNSNAAHWNQYAKQILSEAGLNHVRILAIKTKDSQRPARRPLNSRLSNAKFKSFFGYQLRPWQEALKDYLRESKLQ